MIVYDDTPTIRRTDTTSGYSEPIPKITQQEIDYMNTKKASKKLYDKKKRIVEKRLPINKALLPRKVI